MAKQAYEEMTVDELQKEAKDRGLSGVSGMRKAELVEALEKELPKGKTSSSSKEEKSSGSRSGSRGNLPGILAILKEEHDEVKELFEQFEQQAEDDLEGASAIATQICDELARHAEMEEQIVYPALQEADPDIYYEAHEEHHVAEFLIGEIRGMTPDDAYKAKVIVLGENVRHHIEEEESEAFKTLKKLDSARLDEMATQWEETKAQFIPAA